MTSRSRKQLALLGLVPVLSAPAQEALQNMLAGDNAAAARNQQMQPPQLQDYTLKEGDFRMLVTPSLGLEWNDNVNLAQTNVLSDEIVMPALGIRASYPWSQRNLLYLDITVGYDWYLQHPQFSSFQFNSSSGTGLSFDMGIKDITLNLHDWISYAQGAGQAGVASNPSAGFVGTTGNGAVANTATYGTFQNTAGLSATWDLNRVTLSAGYDHANLLATSGEFTDFNHASEMFFVRAGVQVQPRITTGLETTATLTTYQQNALNDNDAYTVGPYIEFRPDEFLKLTARGGFTTYQFQDTSSAIQTSNQESWYANVTIAHEVTDSVIYSLQAGREVQLGVVSDVLADWYVRPNITWKVIKGWELTTFFFFEHGDEGVGSTGSLPGNSNGNFNWYGGNLSLTHALTSGLSLALNYQLTFRTSDQPDDGYTQNLVSLQLTYHPK
jgi:hypothetical protein